MDEPTNGKVTEMPNGGGRKLPAISVGFDAETQGVALQFDPKAFKSWEFVLAVLEMAKLKAEAQYRVQLAANMQQALQDKARTDALAQSIMGRR